MASVVSKQARLADVAVLGPPQGDRVAIPGMLGIGPAGHELVEGVQPVHVEHRFESQPHTGRNHCATPAGSTGAALRTGFSITKPSITKASSALFRKVRTASRELPTMDSPARLNDVFSSTPAPVC